MIEHVRRMKTKKLSSTIFHIHKRGVLAKNRFGPQAPDTRGLTSFIDS
jgi:hypothetical protein